MAVTDVLAAAPRTVGRYEPIRRLAVGGMAEIFLARVPGLGIEGFEKLVVLKKILPQHALDPELLRMFLDEARLSATLTHPHVTEVYDVGTDGDAPFFAMEYVHGANLRELLRAHARRRVDEAGLCPAESSDRGDAQAPLPLGPALTIVAAAAEGLHYAHDRLGPGGEPLGIVHRDVSPSNVLVSYDGAVKVSDFGIAKWALQRTRTQEGTLKGKFAYMSPEQCRGQPVDRRSDVFALGTILYELTTGTAPFSGESDLAILNRIAGGAATPPAWPEAAGPYPPALSAVVLRALAPNPADRFATMRELQLAVEAFARAAGVALSNVALAGVMQDLFADELAAWHQAQRAGKSLGDHLAARPAGAATAAPAEHTATDAFATTSPRRGPRLGRLAAMAAFAAAFAVAGGVAARRWRTTVERPAPAVHAAKPVTAAPSAPAAAAAASVAPAATVTAREPPAPRRRPRAVSRTERAVAPPPAESRLRSWDPDSPRPP